MNKITNIKFSISTLIAITVMSFVVFYIAPQFFGNTNEAEACCGSAGGNTNSDTPYNQQSKDDGNNNSGTPSTKTVTAKCTVSPSTVTVKPGEDVSFTVKPSQTTNNSTKFEWYLNNTKIYSGKGGGNNYRSYDSGVSGKSLTKPGTYTFTASFSNTGYNNYSCTAKIVVKEAPKPAAKCDAFSVSTKTLPYGGGNVKLTWNTTNATSVSISNVGTVSADGSKTIKVTGTKTFTLTAKGTGGNDTCTAKVTVGSPTAPICNYLNASDTSVEKGGKIILTWDTDNSSDVSINNGIGAVSASGSKSVTINNNTTYVLTTKNNGKEDTCTVSITVEDTPDETPYCDYLHISDDDVEEGDRVILSWNTTNAESVYINNGVGYVSDDGSESVRVYDDTTFTLTAENGGKEDTCRVSVDVDEEDDDNEVTPKCDLDISDRNVSYGDVVTLTWETKYAEEITIEDNHGEEIFNSRQSKYFDGEIDVRVYEDTEFTLEVEGEDRDRDCEVEVNVDDEEITIYEKRDQTPIVAGISFTEVPYTGFEAGPTLTALFYSILVLWALFIAYTLVIKRGTVMGFRLREAGIVSDNVSADIELKKKVEQLAQRYSHRSW